MNSLDIKNPNYLFVNENIGGHRTVHRSLRKILADREDITVEFIDGQDPGLIGKVLRAPIPGLSKLDMDFQPLRGQLVHSFNLRRRVRKRLKQGGVDAMHVYTQNGMLGGAELLRETPSVITTDSTGRLNVFSVPYRTPTRFTAPLSKVNPIFERPVLKAASKVFACSNAVETSLTSSDYTMTLQQVERLEMGVHSPYFTEQLPPRDPAKRPVIVFVGTSLERKGGSLLLDVWREQLRDRADLVLITLETPPAEEGLTVINDLQPGEDRLWDLLAQADIFCLPSLIDQAPNAILEAMAASLPVVAHPNGAIPEMVIDGETGFLVDASKPEPVAEALNKLIDDPELRATMGAAGYRHAKDHYDMSSSVETILAALHHATDIGARPKDSGMVFELHKEVDDEFLKQWMELAAEHSTRFASRPSYVLNWFEFLGKGQMAIATVYRDGQLVALLPLHSRTRLGVTVYRLAGHGLGTIGEALVADPQALKALVEGMYERKFLLALTHLPENSPLVHALVDHGGWTINHQVDDVCPITELPKGTTAVDLRGGRSLKRLRSARNKSAKEGGEVTFEVINSPERFIEVWPELVRVAAAAEEGEQIARLNLTSGVHGSFTRAFMLEEAQQGRLRVVLLRVGGEAMALDVMFSSHGYAESWLTRFDPIQRNLSVGHQLIERSVNDSDAAGITVMDHMIGESDYKQAWETRTYQVGTVIAAPAKTAWFWLPLERLIRGTSELVYHKVQEWRERK